MKTKQIFSYYLAGFCLVFAGPALLALLCGSSLSYAKQPHGLREDFSQARWLAQGSSSSAKRRPTVEADTEVKAQRRGNKTQIDLDEANLEGSSRSPSLSGVQGAQADTDYDFVKLRKKWHPEMMKSTMNLETRK